MGYSIEEQLANAGYGMLGIKDEKEELVLAILETQDIRYLKAIPFLLDKYNLNIERIQGKTQQKSLFEEILIITKKIYSEYNINKKIPSFGKEITNLNYEEFRNEFDMQKSGRPNLMIDKEKIYAERNLHMWLSQLFTDKEKFIIRRILNEKPISKTDYEYYSRKAKKKLNGIINLEDFARTLSSKTPKYDEDLFRLKKLLEGWLEQRNKEESISIRRFFIWEQDKISISYEHKTMSKNQNIHTIQKLKDIENEELRSLLLKYKEHDFS